MSIKLDVENTLRWKWVQQHGQAVSYWCHLCRCGCSCHSSSNESQKKQSNGRVIRWSDGSMSLQLGKELFDVTTNLDSAIPLQRSSSQQTLASSQASQPAITRAQGLTYLVAQHKRAEILQAEAVITGTLTLRPTGMQSETHRKLVRAVGQKHNKVESPNGQNSQQESAKETTRIRFVREEEVIFSVDSEGGCVFG
jgi:RNA polymerase-associated protein LEO1